MLLEKDPRPPAFMVKEIQRVISEMKACINRPVPLAPALMVNKMSEVEADKLTVQLLWKFGSLLEIWPEVRKVALKLKSEGKTLARRV
jgi:hypothetical protein